MKTKTILTMALVLMSPVAFAQGNTRLTIDFKAPTHPRSSLATVSVGSDRAMIFLRQEHQRDLLTLQKEVGFRYLRCHGLFNEEMKVVSRNADGTLRFDWTNVDAFIDQLRKAKLKPFFELGFMPEPIASGKQTIFWWKGNVTPPAKTEEWSLLVESFARHLIRKYGQSEVRTWYFEVWNEPNLDGFWTGGQEKYFELYAASAKALKKVDTQLQVGGPSTAGLAWIPELVAYCKKNELPLDFVSSHAYAAMQGFLDEKGKGGGTVLDTSPDALIGGLRWARGNVPKGTPFFITEWGPSYSPRDPIHDSYVCAPFILDKVRNSEGIVDGLSYWAFTDQFEEPGPPNTPFHGGFGLMNVDGLRKPAFFAYSILAKLYPAEIPTNSAKAIVTRKDKSLRMVIWDYSPFKQDAPNYPYYHRDLKPTVLGDTAVDIRNLPNGTYHITRFGVGYQRNDIYDFYVQCKDVLATGSHLQPETLRQLNALYSPAERLPDFVVKDGTATITLPMRTNDVWFLDIKRSR